MALATHVFLVSRVLRNGSVFTSVESSDGRIGIGPLPGFGEVRR